MPSIAWARFREGNLACVPSPVTLPISLSPVEVVLAGYLKGDSDAIGKRGMSL